MCVEHHLALGFGVTPKSMYTAQRIDLYRIAKAQLGGGSLCGGRILIAGGSLRFAQDL